MDREFNDIDKVYSSNYIRIYLFLLLNLTINTIYGSIFTRKKKVLCMKLKNQERIRSILFFVTIGSLIAIDRDDNLKPYTQNLLSNLAITPWAIDLLASMKYFTKKSPEYVSIKENYDLVVKNTKDLVEKLNIQDDPIKIFSLFIYLYRTGLLSYNHEFKYDMHMKDFPDLLGADVIRGKGVCRSIASFLKDLYRELGYETRTLSVNASSECIKNLTQNSKVKLQETANGGKFAKIVGKITSVIKIPNHLITYIEKNYNGYILDPTNDGILKIDNKTTTFVPLNNKSGKFTNNRLFDYVYYLLGMYGNKKDLWLMIHGVLDNSLSEEDYNLKYLEAQAIIDDNVDVLNEFYENNKNHYEKIYKDMDEQKSFFHSIYIPFVPKIRKK